MARQVVIPQGMEASHDRLHFAPAVRDGDRLFCSGQIGTGADGRPDADREKQFRAAFENLQAVLEAAGAGFDDVVELLTFHVGFSEHIAAFMRAKDEFFPKPPYPAWTAIGVSELAFGALVEIKAVASLRD